MSSTVQQRLLIGVVAAAVLGAVWVQTRPAAPAAPGRAAVRQSTSPAARGEQPVSSPEGTAVRLDVLTASRNEPTGGGRNPFRFQPKAAPASARSAAPIADPGAPDSTAIPAAPSPPPGPPPPPPIPLKFIGVVERASGVRWAVLSDGRATLYGREGDIIDGQYLIARIGLESVEVSHADGRGRQTIRLTGQ